VKHLRFESRTVIEAAGARETRAAWQWRRGGRSDDNGTVPLRFINERRMVLRSKAF